MILHATPMIIHEQSQSLIGAFNMPGVDLSDPVETLPILDRPLLKAHKQLPRRRNDLPTVDPSPAQQAVFDSPKDVPLRDDISVNGSFQSSAPSTAINNPLDLPLTPPSVPQELDGNVRPSPTSSERNFGHAPRSPGIETPVHQRSPPTPDHTPPRGPGTPKGLEAPQLQPSISSRAESFKTAREDQSSDNESPEIPSLNLSTQHWLNGIHPARKVEIKRALGLPLADGDITPKERGPRKLWESNAFSAFDGQWNRPRKNKNPAIATAMSVDTTVNTEEPQQINNVSVDPDSKAPEMKQKDNLLIDTKPVTPEMEEVGNIPMDPERTARDVCVDQKPGTLEMKQVDNIPMDPKPVTPPILKKTRKLREEQYDNVQSPVHARSVSLPDRTIPAKSTLKRDRERVQDSNQIHATSSIEKFDSDIGWSPTSDNSENVNSWRFSTLSATSTTVEAMVIDTPPQRKRTLRHFDKNPALRSTSSPIPCSNRTSLTSNVDSLHRLVRKTGKITNENRWSMDSDLSTSVSSSNPAPQQPETIAVVVIPQRRSSLKSSTSSSRRPSQSSGSYMSGSRPTTAPEGMRGYFDVPHRQRRTGSESNPSATSSTNQGRMERGGGAHPGNSSLSASADRDHSKGPSTTSKTAIPQETLTVIKPQSAEVTPPETTFKAISGVTSLERNSKTMSETTNHQDWQGLRPLSSPFTPFSQPSVQSSSPGPVEISEATAVNLYPHNTGSLVVVENRFQPESRAVQELQREGLTLNMDGPATPRLDLRPPSIVDSPLNNPRAPPKPPAFMIIPPTPAGTTPTEEADRQLEKRPQTSDGKTGLGRRFNSVRRAFSARRHSDSFSSPFARSLSLRTTARNQKKNEDLDSRLHPFWRPRGFWDDFSESDSDGDYRDEDIIVNNSLGMPQKRIIFDGPLSLVRRISNPTRRPSQERVVRKTASYGSLARSRMRHGKKVHVIPALGLRFQLMGWKDWHYRIQKMKERKEEEKREKQRERLRQSIGQHRVVQSDSRYV